MSRRSIRVARVLFCAGWAVALALAFKGGATAIGTTPEHLLGLIPAAYLAAWGPYFLLSGRGPAVRGGRFLAASMAIAFCLALFELPAAFGLLDYRAVFSTPTPPWRRPGNRPDPDLVFVRRGHRHDRIRFAGADLHRLRGASGSTYLCDLLTDRDGFRNDVDLRSSDVIILGDSFIEGLQVRAEELVSSRLADRLGRPVANLGRTGYGPQQELEVLRRFGVPLRPKTCVWAFYEGNDLQDVASYEADRDRARGAGARPESGGRAWYDRSLSRNALAWTIREVLRPEPTRPAAQLAGTFPTRAGGPVPIYFSCGDHEGERRRGASRARSEELRRVRSILAEARAACEKAGIDLIVAFVPTKFRVYRDRCRFGADSLCRDWATDDLPEALAAALALDAPGSGFLDLTVPFRADAASGELPYLADDTHWSARGHEVAAEALAGLIAARRASPPAGSNLATR